MNEFDKEKQIQSLESLLQTPSKVTEKREFPKWEDIANRPIRYEYQVPKQNNVVSFFRKPIGLTVVGGASFALAASLFFVFSINQEPSESGQVASAALMEEKKVGFSPLDVSVSQVKGKVFVVPSGSATSVPLVETYKLASGDLVQTEKGSQVDLHFETGSWIRVTPESQVAVDLIQKTNDGTLNQRFTVKQGKLFASVTKLSKDSDFVVQAGEHLTQVRGTVFSVAYDGKSETVAVREGSVALGDLILNAKQQAVVKDGEQVPNAASIVAPKEEKELKAFYTQTLLAKESMLYKEHARLELVRLDNGTEYRGVILGQSETHLHFKGLDGDMEIPIQNILETEKIR
ncbi:iron dicitrate transport regulator FecR [Leptospira yanagawae]|uniref:Iron dicitrate transport regulator FecR n=1 Tax=Leptospira yanagawae TaxID=293069 RepID=A0ABY2M504_9LEPT|nr:FecR domain-containing protein [Leptospira yanagawae]TGL20822.1 iron dicitrate transport regulator FecR [Leptospira yanagawae]